VVDTASTDPDDAARLLEVILTDLLKLDGARSCGIP